MLAIEGVTYTEMTKYGKRRYTAPTLHRMGYGQKNDHDENLYLYWTFVWSANTIGYTSVVITRRP